jgi:hypothetical protein
VLSVMPITTALEPFLHSMFNDWLVRSPGTRAQTFHRAQDILLPVTRFSTRFLTLLLMCWANIYCCCGAVASYPTDLPQPATRQTAKHCCAPNHTSPKQEQSEPRPSAPQDCDECKFLSIRQNTLIEPAHRDVPALSHCVMSELWVLSPITWTRNETVPVWSDSIKIPTALLDLNTSLLR